MNPGSIIYSGWDEPSANISSSSTVDLSVASTPYSHLKFFFDYSVVHTDLFCFFCTECWFQDLLTEQHLLPIFILGLDHIKSFTCLGWAWIYCPPASVPTVLGLQAFDTMPCLGDISLAHWGNLSANIWKNSALDCSKYL